MLALAGSAALAAGLLGAALAVDVQTNGSFEAGNTGGGFTLEPAGSTDITGWNVVSGSVDYIQGHWVASDGARSIDLNGSSQGAISQTIPTSIGATYTVTFDLSGNPDGAPTVKTLDVSATGAAPVGYSFDVAAAGIVNRLVDMKWRTETYTFMATAASTTILFQSTTAGDFYGPALDNVVITETLPTAEQCKKGGWESMIDSTGNAFKNQGDCVSFFATGGKNPGAGQ
ncbi:MAG: choice-of-anchor C family protein [Dehalococcoidia bacterium]|nr:choice-of-anchor C family protein [Dehalococcoidia bacterium]